MLQDVAKGLEEVCRLSGTAERSVLTPILQVRNLSLEMTKGKEKARQLEMKLRELPDIVVKVVCKYRAELFFKISRKTKLSRLFEAWSARMESGESMGRKSGTPNNLPNGTAIPAPKSVDATSVHSVNGVESPSTPPLSFMYIHQGCTLDAEMTIEEAGIDEADEILAVELMDLTGPAPDDAVHLFDKTNCVLLLTFDFSGRTGIN